MVRPSTAHDGQFFDVLARIPWSVRSTLVKHAIANTVAECRGPRVRELLAHNWLENPRRWSISSGDQPGTEAGLSHPQSLPSMVRLSDGLRCRELKASRCWSGDLFNYQAQFACHQSKSVKHHYCHQNGVKHCLISADSKLEAFRCNPAGGGFAEIAPQSTTFTNYLNDVFLSC